MPRATGQDILLDSAAGKPIRNIQDKAIGMPLMAAKIVASIRTPSRFRANAHPSYNCHGLTFASRRTAITEDGEIYRILTEDDYRPLSHGEVLPGDVAIYFTTGGKIDHSAVVVSVPDGPFFRPVVCSKWGAIGPEVVHAVDDCGACGYDVSNVKYYRVDR